MIECFSKNIIQSTGKKVKCELERGHEGYHRYSYYWFDSPENLT